MNETAFFLLMAVATSAFPAPAQSPTPAPAGAAPQLKIHGTPAALTKPPAKESQSNSTILRKPSVHKTHNPTLEPPGLYYNPEYSGALLDYNKLNADLGPLLSDQPHRPTADEKFWGTVTGAAGYSMAGVAAAQAVGILPGGRTEKKK